MWTVLGRALRRWSIGSKMEDHVFALVGHRKLVATDIPNTLLSQKSYPHPWFCAEADVPWETIHKLGVLVLYPQFFYDPFLDPDESNPEHIAPLLSQPVVELCLRIPLYHHFLNGTERGLARRAFSEDVPLAILNRQWKDRAPESMQSTRRRNHTFLRSMMLGGLLWEKNLLDRPAVESILTDSPISNETNLGELFYLLDVELWLRNLTGGLDYQNWSTSLSA